MFMFMFFLSFFLSSFCLPCCFIFLVSNFQTQEVAKTDFGVVKKGSYADFSAILVKELYLVVDNNATQSQRIATLSKTQQSLAREAVFTIRASKTNHVNIIKMVGVFENLLHEPSLHLVYQHISGSSVEKVLLQDRQMYSNKRGDIVLLLRILLDAAIGLSALHRNNMIHGNLGCNNLLLDTANRVWLVDDFIVFGVWCLVFQI